MSPSLEFFSHVEAVTDYDSDQLEKWAIQALPDCLANPGSGSRDLMDLEMVEISIVSDETIGEVHGEFMDDPTPTDVITFQHGEILISYDTARTTAAELDHSTLDELFLYIVHGLLHLNGHLDKEESEHKEMHRVQDEIWCRVLKSRE